MDLLCIPYAGGTSLCYHYLKKYIPDWLHMTTVTLPGRFGRTQEGSVDSFEDAIEDIFEQNKNIIRTGEYAMFGHSMGSTMAYELVYKILDKGSPLPKHVFFSGRKVPKRSYLYEKIANKDFTSFKEDIFNMGGIPDVLLNYPKELECFMNQIYKDISLLESYRFREGRSVFDFDISVFYGAEDNKLDFNECEYWKLVTKKQCHIYGFDGDHFFINKYAREIVSIICDELGRFN